MARTHKKVSYSPTGKLEDVTPDMAASGIESAFRILEGRWKMVIVFHLFARGILRFSELGESHSRRIGEDADPAAARTGARRRGQPHRLPAGAAQGRVRSDRLGKGDVPGARRPARMGCVTTEAYAARPVRQLTQHERRRGKRGVPPPAANHGCGNSQLSSMRRSLPKAGPWIRRTLR